jgi:hypothetical protein
LQKICGYLIDEVTRADAVGAHRIGVARGECRVRSEHAEGGRDDAENRHDRADERTQIRFDIARSDARDERVDVRLILAG